jgi:hypothetical protein
MKPSPAPFLPGIASKPVYYVAGHEIGRIVLDNVTGLTNGEEGPVVFQPLPRVIQAAR